MESLYCLGSACEFGFFALFSIISMQLIPVSSLPLGMDTTGLGIHQRLPSYLPTYNGIFSIHALNFTPSAVEKTDNYLSFSNSDLPSNSSFDTPDPPAEADSTAQIQEEGTDINELDSGVKEDESSSFVHESTVPQLQVITKTIDDDSTSTSSTTIKAEVSTNHAPPVLNETLKLLPSNSSETLLVVSEDTVIDDGEEPDVFDGLMKSIQGHWQDFVGKMKLSVLDVWKSISQHMMNRLENFAGTL